MVKITSADKISAWENIIISGDIEDINEQEPDDKTLPVDDLPKMIYEGMKQLKRCFTTPVDLTRAYNELNRYERSFWESCADEIPSKLGSLHLFIRRYKRFCRTCLITHSEVEKLAKNDYAGLRNFSGGINILKYSAEEPFEKLDETRRRFFMELNYVIAAQLKRAGFEIIRKEEIAGIDDKMILKIARAIHSRYLMELRKQKSMGPRIEDFDKLDEEIKYSNIDNAYHIPTKLLAIGYRIRKVKKGLKPFVLQLSKREVELMSGIEHLRWSWDKRLNGWTYGSKKDNKRKTHPGLVPFDELSESEKEKDRELVRLIPAILNDIDYEACPVNPNRIRKLSYAIKPQSSINRILEETRELNDQIRGMVKIPPEVENMVRIRNKKIEDAINEIEGSYNYARHIQESFLPDDLYVRECFPESFILYKPKDIVSGDFYFFSKKNGTIIFAAADCTGHGIPGAFLSIVGYGILDQAVNELKLKEPHLILKHIYTRVHRFLRYESGEPGVTNDMDIVLCTLDIGKNLLKWAAIGNPLYRISKGELIEYRSNNILKSSGEPGSFQFTTDEIKLATGDSIYLCSDGFTDQFGGPKRKKYSSEKLRKFLTQINRNPMPEQSEMLYEEFENWREVNNEDQTDDILIIGIRI
jgi:serine phosphatase RsbU (regulator of sigma subunit)